MDQRGFCVLNLVIPDQGFHRVPQLLAYRSQKDSSPTAPVTAIPGMREKRHQAYAGAAERDGAPRSWVAGLEMRGTSFHAPSVVGKPLYIRKGTPRSVSRVHRLVLSPSDSAWSRIVADSPSCSTKSLRVSGYWSLSHARPPF